MKYTFLKTNVLKFFRLDINRIYILERLKIYNTLNSGKTIYYNTLKLIIVKRKYTLLWYHYCNKQAVDSVSICLAIIS